MGPGGFFFPTNPDLADILGRMDFDFENFFLGGTKFLAWAQLGPRTIYRCEGTGGIDAIRISLATERPELQ